MKTGGKAFFSGPTSPLAILGASFFWLWLDSAVFSTTLDAPSSGTTLFETGFMIITIASVAALLFMPVVFRSGTVFSRRFLAITGAASLLASGGSLLLLYSGTASSRILATAGAVLVGVCFGYLTVLWGRVCVAHGHTKALTHISGAWAISLPFNLLLASLPFPASGIAVSLSPLLSGAVFWILYRNQDKARYRIEEKKFSKVDVIPKRGMIAGVDTRLLALILVFCVVFGLMYHFEVLDPASARPGTGLSIVGVRGLTALVFFLTSVSIARGRMKLLFKSALSVLAVGLVVMTIGLTMPGFYRISGVMIAVGYCGFDILVWTMIAFHSYVSDNPPTKTIVITMMAEQIGILVGVLIGIVLSAAVVNLTREFAIIMVLNLLSIIVLIGYTEYSSRLWTLLVRTPSRLDEAFSPADKLGVFAQRFGLTKRELEILPLFVEGRSMPYIAEKLCVSENTVKTHIRHVYTKVGVHDKQTLMDIVETYRGAE